MYVCLPHMELIPYIFFQFQPLCKVDDCLPSAKRQMTSPKNRASIFDPFPCPRGQVCRAAQPTGESCLRYPCERRRLGQCVPSAVLENLGGVDQRKMCDTSATHRSKMENAVGKHMTSRVDAELRFCDRFFIRLEPELLPVVSLLNLTSVKINDFLISYKLC